MSALKHVRFRQDLLYTKAIVIGDKQKCQSYRGVRHIDEIFNGIPPFGQLKVSVLESWPSYSMYVLRRLTVSHRTGNNQDEYSDLIPPQLKAFYISLP